MQFGPARVTNVPFCYGPSFLSDYLFLGWLTWKQGKEDKGHIKWRVEVLNKAGEMKCWGQGRWGELGLGDLADRGKKLADMGDNLPLVNLGSGFSVVAHSSGYWE